MGLAITPMVTEFNAFREGFLLHLSMPFFAGILTFDFILRTNRVVVILV